MLAVLRHHDLHPRTPDQLVGLHAEQGEADGRDIHQPALAVVDRNQIRRMLDDGAHQRAGLIQPALQAAQPRHALQHQGEFIPEAVGLLHIVGKTAAQGLDDQTLIADAGDDNDWNLRNTRLCGIGQRPGFAIGKPVVEQERAEAAALIAAQGLQTCLDAARNQDRIAGALQGSPYQFGVAGVVFDQQYPPRFGRYLGDGYTAGHVLDAAFVRGLSSGKRITWRKRPSRLMASMNCSGSTGLVM